MAGFLRPMSFFSNYPNKLFRRKEEDEDCSDVTESLILSYDVKGYETFPKLQDERDLEEARAQVIRSSYQGVSVARSCFNTTNALTGIGVLAMPYALSQGGWLSFAFFFLIAIVFCYTGHLIQRCMDSDPSINTYVDIAGVAFGYKGKLAIAVIMYFELYISGVSHLILEGDNLDNLFPNTSLAIGPLSIEEKQLFVVVAALIVLPTTWYKSLKVLAYFSAVGVIASFVLFGALLWTGITDTGFHAKGRLLNMSGLPMALGLYAICFCGHAVFPTVYASMKDTTRFSKVLVTSFSLGTINCALVAVCGYLMYGDDVQSQVTLNLPSGKLYSRIAIFTTLITPFTKYAWAITPIAMAMEERFDANGKEKPNILYRTLLVIGTVIIALTVPFFDCVMAFIGSFLGTLVAVLLPCICYLKIFKASRKSAVELAKIFSILFFGTVVSIMGTYTSVAQIFSKL